LWLPNAAAASAVRYQVCGLASSVVSNRALKAWHQAATRARAKRGARAPLTLKSLKRNFESKNLSNTSISRQMRRVQIASNGMARVTVRRKSSGSGKSSVRDRIANDLRVSALVVAPLRRCQLRAHICADWHRYSPLSLGNWPRPQLSPTAVTVTSAAVVAPG